MQELSEVERGAGFFGGGEGEDFVEPGAALGCASEALGF
jgi:hypothetical protein